MSSKKGAGAPTTDVADVFAGLSDEQRELFEALRSKLTTAKTLADLNARVDDDFKADVYKLPEGAQRELRDQFSITRDDVKNKVKMDSLAGKVVIITDPPDFPPASKDYPDSVFCVIKGKIEDSGETFECVSGAVRVVRHFQDSKLDTYPQRLEFYRESQAAMTARNAKPLPDGTMPSPMWLVRRVGMARANAGKDGVPF